MKAQVSPTEPSTASRQITRMSGREQKQPSAGERGLAIARLARGGETSLCISSSLPTHIITGGEQELSVGTTE
ncbi:unnamed protein product [Boreogadus saida]